MSNDADAIVTQFFQAWERRSLEDVLDLMASDIVYQNVPIPAMRGKAEVQSFIAPLFKHTIKVEFKVLAKAASSSGGAVFSERLDRFHYPSGIVDIPVMGIIVVRDGKVSEWRDYADIGTTMAGFAAAGIDPSQA